MTLADLAIDHPFYCSRQNYHSSSTCERYDTMTEFLAEYGTADIDMNLVFRWDVAKHDDGEDGYYANVFIIQQRCGIFFPIYIESITEEEVAPFVAYLKPHQQTLQQLWEPL